MKRRAPPVLGEGGPALRFSWRRWCYGLLQGPYSRQPWRVRLWINAALAERLRQGPRAAKRVTVGIRNHIGDVHIAAVVGIGRLRDRMAGRRWRRDSSRRSMASATVHVAACIRVAANELREVRRALAELVGAHVDAVAAGRSETFDVSRRGAVREVPASMARGAGLEVVVARPNGATRSPLRCQDSTGTRYNRAAQRRRNPGPLRRQNEERIAVDVAFTGPERVTLDAGVGNDGEPSRNRVRRVAPHDAVGKRRGGVSRSTRRRRR